ncbi:hypothetical protein DNTS_024252 [Danionella cerebrum]|uniref:Death domain-containing protein n=1 Tax=Danionella cerebrum TaxID=2873325 RepID=A0A553R369_9TELE|nr:hypothetical protein DNTS_024252 [Danionella translucida]
MTVSSLCFYLQVSILYIAPFSQSLASTNKWCEAGYYKKQNHCVKCESGFFNDKPNVLSYCSRCTDSCDEDGFEVVHKNCTATQDLECVCKSGFYRSDDFCKPCHICRSDCGDVCNKPTTTTTTRAITTTATAAITTTSVACGDGYFQDGGECKSCVEIKCKNESCQRFCSSSESTGLPALWLVSLIIFAFLGCIFFLLVISCRRKWFCWQNKDQDVAGPPNLQNEQDQANDIIINSIMEKVVSASSETTMKTQRSYPRRFLSGDLHSIISPLIADRNPKLMQALQKESWPAPVLYIIIREIPVSRWKEFLRQLSVSDDEMERVELEPGLSYLEKQYLMLRLWTQSCGAKLEKIYSTLHYMNLSGCAQELQEKLEQLQGSSS